MTVHYVKRDENGRIWYSDAAVALLLKRLQRTQYEARLAIAAEMARRSKRRAAKETER